MSDRAKVLLVGVTLPKIGGFSLTIDKLKRNQILQDSFQVEVCNPYTSSRNLRDKILSRFFNYPRNSQQNLALLKASIKVVKPDLIHFFTSSFSNFWTNSFLTDYAHRNCIPYLLNMRGGGFIKFFHGCTEKQRRKIVRTLRQADLLLVQSDEWAEYYRSLHQDIKIAVLPNYVQIPDVAELSDSARKKAILYLGHLKKSKGVALLLEAWQQLHPEIPEWELWLAGPDREGFADTVSAVVCRRHRISFHGAVQGEQKEKMLQQASIFVLPSEAEGLPNSMLEAMAYRIPVIVTPVGAVPGIITDRENGLMIEIGSLQQLQNAITQLAGSPETRMRLGSAGFDSVQANHSEQLFTQELIGLYQGLLNAVAS